MTLPEIEKAAVKLVRAAAALPTGEVRLMGLDELTEFVGATKPTVSSWRRRGLLPPPAAELKCGPVWLASTIESWAETRGQQRSRTP